MALFKMKQPSYDPDELARAWWDLKRFMQDHGIHAGIHAASINFRALYDESPRIFNRLDTIMKNINALEKKINE